MKIIFDISLIFPPPSLLFRKLRRRATPTRLQNDRTRNTARRMDGGKTRDVVGIINI